MTRCWLVLALVCAPLAARAAETALAVPMHDGFALDAKIASPDGAKDADVRRVIVLVHGSGAENMDEDLTAASKDKVKNLVFHDLSDALVAKGFTVLRYHKRNYQCQLAIKADPKFKDGPVIKALVADPYGTFVHDIRSMLDFAAGRFPKAKLYLLGHSEGTYTALQAAHERGGVAGVALIGFMLTTLDTLVVEQCVYRPLALFDALDTDRDGTLSAQELAASSPVAASLRAQLPVLDLDGNGKLERVEFMAGNFSNLLINPISSPAAQVYAGTHPTAAAILKEAAYPVCFFQGLWDNQTPAYNAKAVDLVNRQVWKKANLSFQYFEKLGHALDPRDDYGDIAFRPMDRTALAQVAARLAQQFTE